MYDFYANISDCIDNAWEVFLSGVSGHSQQYQKSTNNSESFHPVSQHFACSWEVNTSDTSVIV